MKQTVQAGVRYGYMEKKGGKYFAAPFNFPSDEGGIDGEDNPQEEGESGVPEDRSRMRGRRRRSVRRGRSRVGRRRRSRSSRR